MKSRQFFALLIATLACGFVLTGSAQAQETKPLEAYIYPLAPAMKAPPKVVIDTTDYPEGRAWAEKSQQVVAEWFPIIWQLLSTQGMKEPAEVKLVFQRKQDAPAYATGGNIYISGPWISAHPDDFGMTVHELTHLVQSYPGHPNNPGWLVEGIADFTRWWRYEPEGPRPKIDPEKNNYDNSYRITAAFLAWVSGKYDKRLVPTLDKALRDGTYSDEIWKTLTGKDVATLWSEFAPKIVDKPGEAVMKPAGAATK